MQNHAALMLGSRAVESALRFELLSQRSAGPGMGHPENFQYAGML